MSRLQYAFPSTTVNAYGGKANFSEGNVSTPGPTFEAVGGQHIRVHFVNQLDGPHISPSIPRS